MWQALCTRVLGRPNLASRPEYATAEDRLAHGDELERDIESVLVTDTTDHWVTVMLDAGLRPGRLPLRAIRDATREPTRPAGSAPPQPPR